MTLDFRARDLSRFWSLLELPDGELIDAIGGRRRGELHEEHRRWKPPDANASDEFATTCIHRRCYPWSLREHPLAPRALSLRGGPERFGDMLKREVVAIVGTRRASDYGMETARALARSLAASGLTVASGLGEGIAAAAHTGGLEAGGPTLAVMTDGVERCSPAWCRGLYGRIVRDGCAISERLVGSRGRPRCWWEPARSRTLALLARLVIVVEAEEHPRELACAAIAQSHDIPVAAVPGRVSSPASRGCNLLLMHGAKLIRGPQDALDALYGVGAREASHQPSLAPADTARIGPRLERVLRLVGSGHDTPAKLARQGEDAGEVAMGLIELELAGRLVRGDGGRYLLSARAATT